MPVPPSRHRPALAGRTRRAAAALAVAASGVALLAPGPARAGESALVIDGRGFGHGVGLAQDGAYWLGLSGRTSTQILATFFPGTTLAVQHGNVRVPLAAAGVVSLSFPNGGTINGRRVAKGASARATARDGVVSVAIGAAPEASDPEGAPSTEAVAADVAAGEQPVAAIGLGSASPAGRILRWVGQRLRGQTDAVPAQGTPAQAPPVSTPPVEPSTAPPEVPVTVPAEPVVDPALDPTATAPTTLATVPEPAATASVPSTDPPTAATDTTPPAEAGGAAVPGSAVVNATSVGVIGLGGRRYRGTIELKAVGSSIKVTNDLDVEDYLRGMGEVTSGAWPAAALQSQAVVARTYALRMMGSVGEVCPTQRCQVYLGAQAEYPEMDAAVQATRGRVVVYHGALAATYYSASGGGTMATPEEAFGGSGKDAPYLRAGVYPAGDLKPWVVTMRLAEVGRRVGYRGSVGSVTVTQVGPSGRATAVTVDGSAGPMTVRGPAFDAALGLRSTYFTLRMGSLDEATIQPDDAAAAGSAGGLLAGSALDLGINVPLGASSVPDTAVAETAPDTLAATTEAPAEASAAPTTAPTIAPGRVRRAGAADRSTAGATMLLGAVAAVLAVGGVVRARRSRRR